MEIMKIVVPVCLLLMTTCFAVENSTTKLEQQLNVQKREKQYLIEDDPSEGPEQKRDERQSSPVKNLRNLDPKQDSRIINIRLAPPQNILTVPKQAIKPGPQRIPTKIPVILKTANIVPGPAHAIRMKMLENRINQTKCNANKENIFMSNNFPPTPSKDSIPYFTIEDKTTRKSESPADEKPDLGSNVTMKLNLHKDVKEIPSIDGISLLNKDGNDYPKEGKDDQVISNSERRVSVQKPVHFFVDEPEPLPPPFRRQKNDNTASQSKNDPPNKIKEMPIVKKGNKKPKKDETKNVDDDNDPDVVKISNGTHLISIKKIPNHERYKVERLGEEDNAPTEERIVNRAPPKPKPVKPIDEPEKHSFSIKEQNSRIKENTVGLTELTFRDIKNKEEKAQNDCVTTITKNNYGEIEEKTRCSPPGTLQPTNPPTTYTSVNQESWNYLQNPYYNAYYQNIYDQYGKNYGLAQNTPNIYGVEVIDPRNYEGQVNPYKYESQATVEPYTPEITQPYYPNVTSKTNTDPVQYPYNTNENQPEIVNAACPEVRSGNSLDRIWKSWKDVEIKTRNAQANETEVPYDIDIRRDYDGNIDGNNGENGIGKVVKPYAASTLPININGALVYPYVNPGYRYMR